MRNKPSPDWPPKRIVAYGVEYVRGCARDQRTTQYCAEAVAATARAEKAERDREHFRDALRRIFNMIPGTDSEVKQYAIDVLADYEEAQAALEGGDDE